MKIKIYEEYISVSQKIVSVVKMIRSKSHPSLRHKYTEFVDLRNWSRTEHIPWEENPLVRLEIEAQKNGKSFHIHNLKYEWRYKGTIFHRDIHNNVWQKVEGQMKYIGIYNPANDTFDYTALEPR